MSEIPGMSLVLDFVERTMQNGIESTGASVVTYTGNLYNVVGSTHDPKRVPGHDDEAWKQLLIAYGIDHDCYVTNPDPGGSHPAFSVGGHMTPNSDGRVARGGSCYLMPLCSWHNHTARDGTAFSHTETRMLQLTGYDEGELAATFQLRLPSRDPYALLYYSAGAWKSMNLAESQAHNLQQQVFDRMEDGQDVRFHVLVERVSSIQTRHFISSLNLPRS